MHRLEASEDKIACVVDQWLDRIIGGFITEFTVDTSVSYNEAKRCFLKGPRGKYIKSLTLGLKFYCAKRELWNYINVRGYAKWENL